MAINPYRPGVGTPPPYLADRERQLQAFRKYLGSYPERRQNVRLTGLRGVGKTVLLKEYRKIALSQDWIVIRRDLSKRLNDEEPFAIAISDDLQSAAEGLSVAAKMTAKLKSALAAIEQVKVGPVSVKKGPGGAPAVLEDRIRDALMKVGELAKATDRGALLLYDEAHVLADREKQHHFPLSALLGGFVEVQDDDDEQFPVMLVLSGLPPLVGNIQDARSHSERMFRAEELANLALKPADKAAASKAAMALIEPAKSSGITFHAETAQLVAERVDGYPYFIQKYGEALWDAAEEDGLDQISTDLFEAAETQIQAALDLEFFEGRYRDVTPGDQKTLRVAASLGAEAFEVGSLIKEFDRKANATQQSVNRLLQANLVYRLEQGNYAYTAPLFGDFLRRRHPRETDDR